MSDDTARGGGARRLGSPTDGYLLTHLVGSGPFGAVHKGYDREGDVFAIKVLRPELAADPTVVARFVQECSLAVRFDDPYLVRVTDFVVEASTLAVVMEMVDGRSLRDAMADERTLPPARALAICADVLRGLSTAHAFGMVHRNVHPGNILLTEADGRLRPKVADHELGWLHESGGAGVPAASVGTPHYRAPEAVEGKPLSEAADVFSVGVVLHELLFGVVPFAQTSHTTMPGDQLLVRPDGVPDDLWRVIERLSAPRPGARPGSAAAATELDGLAMSLAGLPEFEPLAGPPAPEPAPVVAHTEAWPSSSPVWAPVSHSEGPLRSRVLMGAAVALAVVAAGGAMAVATSIGGPEGGGTGLKSATMAASEPGSKNTKSASESPGAAPGSDSVASPFSARNDAAPGTPLIGLGFGQPQEEADGDGNGPEAGSPGATPGPPGASPSAGGPTTTPASPGRPGSQPVVPGQPSPSEPSPNQPTPSATPRPSPDPVTEAPTPTPDTQTPTPTPDTQTPTPDTPDTPTQTPDTPTQTPDQPADPETPPSDPPDAPEETDEPGETNGPEEPDEPEKTDTPAPKPTATSTPRLTPGATAEPKPFPSLGTVRSDIDGDGQVDCFDLGIVRANFGERGGFERGDVSADGRVNGRDIVTMAADWTGPSLRSC